MVVVLGLEVLSYFFMYFCFFEGVEEDRLFRYIVYGLEDSKEGREVNLKRFLFVDVVKVEFFVSNVLYWEGFCE